MHWDMELLQLFYVLLISVNFVTTECKYSLCSVLSSPEQRSRRAFVLPPVSALA